MRKFFTCGALALLAWHAVAREESAPAGAADDVDRARIEMHVGIPEQLYIGQSLADLRSRYTGITITPFASDDRVRIARITELGASCFIAGESESTMEVISVGFNFDGTYEGVGESGYRTVEGIGKGSTVNDLLGTYGRAEITEMGLKNSLQRRMPDVPPDPNAPRKYLFTSDDGSVKTYFQSEGAMVVRVVINHLAPINRYILKRNAVR